MQQTCLQGRLRQAAKRAGVIRAQTGLSPGETTVGRGVLRTGGAKLSARPRYHAQDEAALAFA